jgi:hypothetical protein
MRWICVAFGLLASCTEQNRIVVHTGTLDDVTRPDVGDEVEIVHVSTEGYVAQKPGYYAVHDASDWLFVWKDPRPDAQPPPPPSGTSFDRDMLFVATAPDAAAKSIEIKRVVEQASGLHIYVVERLPGANCPVTASGPPPMDIVEMASTGADIHVHADRVRDDPCGPPPDAMVLCRVAGIGQAGARDMIAKPGQKIDCDSNQSRPHTGTITDRVWQLEPAPGSTTKLAVGPESRGITFFPDAWGTYRVSVEVRDQVRAGSAYALVEAPPPADGFPIELHWTKVDRNDDPSMYPRVELRVSDGTDECSPTAAKPWCEVHVTGTVQRAIVRPEPGKTYRASVVYDDFRLKGSAMACVRTFPQGPPLAGTRPRAPLPRGAQPLSARVCDEALHKAGDAWDLGTLDPASRTFVPR